MLIFTVLRLFATVLRMLWVNQTPACITNIYIYLGLL